ncbi:MAG: hypothetical protein GXN92_02630, partial [Candidatus Micrarchaeota archaeon]|nr:hypothetical protein [Candidatus Micrarchaeota archaeon]
MEVVERRKVKDYVSEKNLYWHTDLYKENAYVMGVLGGGSLLATFYHPAFFVLGSSLLAFGARCWVSYLREEREKNITLPILTHKGFRYEIRHSMLESLLTYKVYEGDRQLGRIPFMIASDFFRPRALVIAVVQGMKGERSKKWLRTLSDFFHALEEITGLDVYMLDPNRNLYVTNSGARLPHSIYHNLFEPTEERFLPNPFYPVPKDFYIFLPPVGNRIGK